MALAQSDLDGVTVHLTEGGAIARASWQYGRYVRVDSNGNLEVSVCKGKRPWNPSLLDLKAQDWVAITKGGVTWGDIP